MNGGILSLGKGRLSGACMIGDECIIIISTGGTLRKKKLLPGRKIVDEGIVSYSNDCYEFPFGKLTMDSEVSYEANNQ